MKREPQPGFTLIELSIVLVIIGLLIGGILAGRDMIRTAQLRGQIRQIEQYRTAVHTFKNKYSGLPGDIKGQNFGFVTRTGNFCDGDNDAIIRSCFNYSSIPWAGLINLGGESTYFWSDLAKANLINGTYATASGILASLTTAQIPLYLPAASIGNNDYIHAFGDGATNFFVLSQIIGTAGASTLTVSNNIIAADAFGIDSKMDDGLPVSGNVIVLSSPVSFQLYNQPVGAAYVGLCSNTSLYNVGDTAAPCSLRFTF